MSAKNMDPNNRFRSKTVSFRMSPEEAERLDRFVALTGMTKQDYLIHRCLQEEITVYGNSRVHKALRTQMEELLTEFRRLEVGERIDTERIEWLQTVTNVWAALKPAEEKIK